MTGDKIISDTLQGIGHCIRLKRLRLVVECYVIVVIMIKLQTDFDLSTIIEKRCRCLGGGKYPRRQMSGGKCPRGKRPGGASDRNPFISVVVLLIFHQIYCKL